MCSTGTHFYILAIVSFNYKDITLGHTVVFSLNRKRNRDDLQCIVAIRKKKTTELRGR
jgi:hypothetical protein